MKSFLEAVSERVLVCDGAMGTELQARGLPAALAQEQWNVDSPDKVLDVHRRYVEAGADVLLTNTFGANRAKLSKRGLEGQVSALNRAGAAVALEAAADGAYVLGDIGPTGELIAPFGPLSREAVQELFAEQADALAGAGVHAIIIETMMSMEEAALAVLAVRRTCSLPVIASMTFQKGRGGYRTLMGEKVEEAAAALEQAGASLLGTNCGGGIEQAIDVIAELARHTRLPLLAEPNAGVPKLQGAKTVFEGTPDVWAQRLPDLLAHGVRVLGGCCGTTPDHVRRIRQVADQRR